MGMGKEDQGGFMQEASFELGPEGWALEEKDIPGRDNHTKGVNCLLKRPIVWTLALEGHGFNV